MRGGSRAVKQAAYGLPAWRGTIGILLGVSRASKGWYVCQDPDNILVGVV